MRFHSRKNRKTLTGKAHWQVGFESSRSSRTRKSWKSFHALKVGILNKKPTEISAKTTPRGVKAGKATLADLIRIKNTPL